MVRPHVVNTSGEWSPRGQAGRVRINCVGESKFQAALVEIAGGKQRESQYIETNAVVRREPGNAFDGDAVQVLVAGSVVAYLPREVASRYASAMDAADVVELACPAEIRGGWKSGEDEGHFGVVVWLPAPERI